MSSIRAFQRSYALLLIGLCMFASFQPSQANATRNPRANISGRERLSINDGWRFIRFPSSPDSLSYNVLKPWILPAANDFLLGAKYSRPSQDAPGGNVSYLKPDFDDSDWEQVDLPHDWAITGSFNTPNVDAGVGGLPINGVGFYRRDLSVDSDILDSGRSIFLDVDGAMAYSSVWLNGQLVGGWPYGYNSFRLDLTPYAKPGVNQLSIRLENGLDSARWYPGAGIYRNVWLVTVNPVHVAQYGTYITTPNVSPEEATIELLVEIKNERNASEEVKVVTEIFEVDPVTRKHSGSSVATIPASVANVTKAAKIEVKGSVKLAQPKLWGPPPTQKPNEYVAVTTLTIAGTAIDTYETTFGIRSVAYDPNRGVLINGEHVYIKGSCNHHDLGSLGAAFNYRAAERQIEMLQEMGNNALRTSHNPPAPEFLDIADRLGLVVMDEIFDTWNYPKTPTDFYLIFQEWHEPDLRSFIRRDRNHPSIISWSIGNELLEQRNSTGGATGKMLQDIVHEEDSTRKVTVGLNNAQPGDPLSDVIDIIGLNYQGEGKGVSWNSSFPYFHSAYPDKMIWSTESASTISSRGVYIFPITSNKSAVVGGNLGQGGDPINGHVSAYELYAPPWAASPDKVFEQQDRNSYVAGEFVWTGWDYIGEPTPYNNLSRSSYFGIIDLAGFKKDRFYLYQARWRPDLPLAHILPHWTWPDREGLVTPIHVFTSGDEAELFVNGRSAGRQKRGTYDYRLRWDNVTYSPGEIQVTTWKDGKEWASASHRTVGAPTSLVLTADRNAITADGQDLSFITAAVVDGKGDTVPQANNEITFSIDSSAGKIVSTDNGDPTDYTPFPSLSRKAFSGLALAIVKANPGLSGEIVVRAKADGLADGHITLKAV